MRSAQNSLFTIIVLHHPGYRAKFAADLKKQLPRLPVPVSMDDYRLMVKVGRDLAALHLHYEDIEGYGLKEVKTGGKVSYEVTGKLRWGSKGKNEDRSKIVVNGTLTLEGIPAKAHEYVVNGRSALEWIIDRYQIRTDKDSGITNDPNDWGREHGNPRYIVELIQSVTTVSVKTVDLVKKLEGVKLRKQHSDLDLQAGDRAANPGRNPELLRDVGGALKFREYLPVYSYRAACGKFGEGAAVEPLGWIRVDGLKVRNERLFVLRVQGRSMEPKIADGSYCIFEAPEIAVEREDHVLLVQYRGEADPETGGAYTVKRYVSKVTDPALGGDVVLKPINKDYKGMRFAPSEAAALKPIAAFKRVL